MFILLLLDRAEQVGDQWNTRKGRTERVLWLFQGFYVVALVRVSFSPDSKP
jgi:hypothetical protein